MQYRSCTIILYHSTWYDIYHIYIQFRISTNVVRLCSLRCFLYHLYLSFCIVVLFNCNSYTSWINVIYA